MATFTSLLSNVQKQLITNLANIKLAPKLYSSELLNYVEPQLVNEVYKTAFYSKVNTNLSVGDRVFIIDGNYSSDSAISANKYKKGTDGYQILSIDRCRIVLDIDYTGVLPFINYNLDSLIKVHYVETQREFDYINRKLISPSYSVASQYKFEIGNTSLIYANSAFTGGSSDGNVTWNGIGYPGFWIRISGVWTDITSNLLSNNLTSFLWSGIGSEMIIIGGTFENNGVVYQEKVVYQYLNNQWIVDSTYQPAIISKLNFRDGNFKGNWNDGIYGTYNKKINWTGSQSNWNSGVVLYAYWNDGLMSSKSVSTDKSYYTSFDKNRLPVQTTDLSNNKGFGYNFIYDSSFLGGNVVNGNFTNVNVGSHSATFSASDIYLGLSQSFAITLSGGSYKLCNFNFADVNSASIFNSDVTNSRLLSSKVTNSQLVDSVFNQSQFKSDSAISILAYNKEAYVNPGLSSSVSSFSDRKTVHKFYISNTDYLKLKNLNSFYIKGVNVYSSGVLDNSVIGYFDRRFILDYVVDDEYPIVSSLSPDVVITCSLKTASENYKISSVVPAGFLHVTTGYTVNPISLPSIDIVFDRGFLSSDTLTVDITNGFIVDSDFYSGIFENSTWQNGNHINLRDYKIQRLSDNSLDMSLNGSYPNYQLDVQLSSTASVYYGIVNVNDIVYLDSIDYDLGYQQFNIAGRYKVTSISPTRRLTMMEYLTGSESSIINAIGITGGGTFSTIGITPNYNSITKLDINESIIDSGLFRANYFRNSLVNCTTFDNQDIVLTKSNIDQMKMINLIFKNNNNTLNGGFVYNSFWFNGTFSNGIINESVWANGTFSNGLFISGNWNSGVFDNGLFYSSNDDITGSGRIEGYSYQPEYYLWQDGIFNNGDFYNSNWYDGTFSNGKFYKSLWYDGQFNNGILGDKNISNTSTQFIGGSWSNGVVENATVGSTISNVNWYNGTFNNGVFISGATTSTIWSNGSFNGGNFTGYATWVNGNFNGGNFTSVYGFSLSSTYSTDFSWQGGKFNGGIFGNGTIGTNSTWYYGEFNDGVFQGKVWNSGVFYNGNFYGSGTHSIRNQEQLYYNSFTQSDSYYGLWLDGWVIDNKDLIIKDKKVYSILQRKIGEKRVLPRAQLTNILWAGGTFSHKGGTITNSMWTDGVFQNGTFQGGSFNPWLETDIPVSGQYTQGTIFGSITATFSMMQGFNFNTQSCVWYNGTFDSGNFYYSDWYTGKFLNGTMSGAIWHDGVWQYGDAINTHWQGGSWKNGNWYGSNILVDGTINPGSSSNILDPTGVFGYVGNLNSLPNSPNVIKSTPGNSLKNSNIIFRTMQSAGTSSLHVWNTFSASKPTMYHTLTNNKEVPVYKQIFYGIGAWQYGLQMPYYNDRSISLVNTMTGSASVNGATAYGMMGSGVFESGIWENGIWNNGERIDNDVYILDDVIQYLKIDNNNWRVQLSGMTGSISEINVGDKVVIGNIIAIDVNENRRLIKEVFTVIETSAIDIVFQFKTNFPLRRIERDSTYHKIYVTKNIWKSGAFLNGIFQGVWGNGIFKGFPHISEMFNTQWIDGSFYGGHFYATQSAIAGSWSVATYSTGLVQNFSVFSDENVWSGPISGFTASSYNSWIDVNFQQNYSATKLYYDTYLVNSDQSGNTIYTNKLNLYGDITFDVLASSSNFRDSGTSIIKNYSLGTKYKIYQDFMGVDSEFNDVNILNYGWTYSVSGTYTNILADQYVDPNNSDGNGILSIYNNGSQSMTASGQFFYLTLQSSDFTLNKRRYTLCEFDSINTNLATASIIILKTPSPIYPRTIFVDDRFSAAPYVFTYSSSAEVLNHYHTNTGSTKKFEYFYNKKALDLLITGGVAGSIGDKSRGYQVDNIDSYEIDMVPFFNYWNPPRLINLSAVTYNNLISNNITIPYSATANYIDFSVYNTNDAFDNPSISPSQIINVTPPPKPITTIHGGINPNISA